MSHLLVQADARRIPLGDGTVHCVVCSPPYFALRAYLPDGHPSKHLEIGAEPTPAAFVATMVQVGREVRRVIREDGTWWLNLSDSYNSAAQYNHHVNGLGLTGKIYHEGDNGKKWGGHRPLLPDLKNKDLLMIPARVAIALQEDGWYLRSMCPWVKRAAMPESVGDRPSSALEYIFLLAKNPNYFYDAESVRKGFNDRPNVARVIQGSHLRHEGIVLGQDFGLEKATTEGAVSPSGVPDSRRLFEVSIRLATAILDRSKRQHQVGLGSLDTEIGQEQADSDDGITVSRPPEIHRAAMLALRFLNADMAPKHFLQEMDRLGVTLTDRDILGETGGVSLVPGTPSVYGDRNTAIGVDHAREISQDQFGFHDEEYTPRNHTSSSSTGRNRRNSDWWFESVGMLLNGDGDPLGFDVNTAGFAGAHFATWPSKLVEPMIRASTSEAGCCGLCGEPWRRRVEREGLREVCAGHLLDGKNAIARQDEKMRTRIPSISHSIKEQCPKVTTLGWHPACSCPPQPPVPATVLDIFCGSGTTLVVAEALGRNGVGCDLSRSYLEMSQRRITRPHARITTERPGEPLPLFDGRD